MYIFQPYIFYVFHSIVSSNNAKYQLNTDNSLYWVLALYQMDA